MKSIEVNTIKIKLLATLVVMAPSNRSGIRSGTGSQLCGIGKDNKGERVNELWAHVWFDQISRDIFWCPSVTQHCAVQAHTDLDQDRNNQASPYDGCECV